MTDPLLTAIYLNDEDLKKFMEFQKHYELFGIFDKNKVFDIQFGKVIINIANGLPQNIISERVVWKR